MPAETYGAEDAVKELFQSMADLGVVYLEAQYQGGGDEGGVQDIQAAQMASGVDISEEHTTWRSDLWMKADAILTCKYGGWAWEGTAWGMLYADATTGRVWTKGEHTIEEEDPDPIEVQVERAEIGAIVNPKELWQAAVINGETMDSYASWHRQWSAERRAESAAGN